MFIKRFMKKRIIKAVEALKIAKFEKEWTEALMGINGRAHYNEFNESYCFHYPVKRQFGITGYVPLSRGLTFDGFNKIKQNIGDSLGIAIVAKHERENRRIKVATIRKLTEFPFKPAIAPMQHILVGYDIYGEPYLLDLAKSSPHLLVTGASGTGKTFIFYMIMANLLYNYNTEDNYFEVVLFQIMKNELSAFENCEPCKKHLKNGKIISELRDVSLKLDQLEDLVRRRGNVLKNSNVRTWNKVNKDKKNVPKLFPIYICIDELAFFMPGPKEKGSSANLKKNCIHRMVKLGQAGRSTAIHIIALCQRLTATNVDPNMKSNFARLTAFQNSVIDSDVAIGSPDATRLLDREVILKSAGIMDMLYIPTIKEDCSDLVKYVDNMSIPKTISDDDLNSLSKEYGDLDSYLNKLSTFTKNFEKAINSDAKFKNDEEAFDAIANGSDKLERSVTLENDINIKQPATSNTTSFDKKLFNFIDSYYFITQSLAVACTGNTSYPKKRLPKLSEPQGDGKIPPLLVSTLRDLTGAKSNKNTKVYYPHDSNIPDKAQFYHDYIAMSFYDKLYRNGFKIESYVANKEVKIPQGTFIRPDANIIAMKDGKRYHIFLEIDEGHATGESKIVDYESLRVQDFCLIIATEKNRTIPTSCKFKIIKENFEFALGWVDKL